MIEGSNQSFSTISTQYLKHLWNSSSKIICEMDTLHYSPFLTAINIIFYLHLNFGEIHLYKLMNYFKNQL